MWIALLILAVAATQPQPCLEDRLALSTGAERVRQALDVLSASGRDPSDYRVELRLEDASHPDRPELSARRETSVLFLPTRAGDYAVRVHPTEPCLLGWVWTASGTTVWQRRLVSRALHAAGIDESRGRWDDLQVVESPESIDVLIWWAVGPGAASLEPRDAEDLRIRISRDLETIEVIRRP